MPGPRSIQLAHETGGVDAAGTRRRDACATILVHAVWASWPASSRGLPASGSYAGANSTLLRRHHADHPADAEAVLDHAEARRPERLCQRHLHVAALGQRGERAFGFGFVRNRE